MNLSNIGKLDYFSGSWDGNDVTNMDISKPDKCSLLLNAVNKPNDYQCGLETSPKINAEVKFHLWCLYRTGLSEIGMSQTHHRFKEAFWSFKRTQEDRPLRWRGYELRYILLRLPLIGNWFANGSRQGQKSHVPSPATVCSVTNHSIIIIYVIRKPCPDFASITNVIEYSTGCKLLSCRPSNRPYAGWHFKLARCDQGRLSDFVSSFCEVLHSAYLPAAAGRQVCYWQNCRRLEPPANNDNFDDFPRTRNKEGERLPRLQSRTIVIVHNA